MKKQYRDRKLHEFLVEPHNQLAYETANQIITSSSPYSPIVLCGPRGAGKTHLIEAIARGLEKKFDQYEMLFYRGETFYSEYVTSMRQKQYQIFRKRCRNCHVFILDDLHDLRNKKQTQCELLFTVNELIEKQRLIVITSEQKPKNLATFNSALSSRLYSGLFIGVQPISKQTVIEHCQKIAKRLSFQFQDSVLHSLLSQYTGSVGEFVERFEKLLLFCMKNNEKITSSLITRFMARYRRPTSQQTADDILQRVCTFYDLEHIDHLVQKGGARTLKEPRYIAICLTKDLLQLKNEELKEMFHRSESSIRHALKTVARDEQLKKAYSEMKAHLNSLEKE